MSKCSSESRQRPKQGGICSPECGRACQHSKALPAYCDQRQVFEIYEKLTPRSLNPRRVAVPVYSFEGQVARSVKLCIKFPIQRVDLLILYSHIVSIWTDYATRMYVIHADNGN